MFLLCVWFNNKDLGLVLSWNYGLVHSSLLLVHVMTVWELWK